MVGSELRQQAVLDGIVERASEIDAIEGIIVLGSFAGGQPDDLSDLDLVAVAAAGRLEEAWETRNRVAGDVLVMWQPQSNIGREIKWANWLTHDLVKVEWGVAAPGSRELAEPYRVVYGPPSVASGFPRVDAAVVRARREALSEQQEREFDLDALTLEERLGWSLWQVKLTARALRSQSDELGNPS
jgi:hypothetical protein